jgi:hypothetical protein
MLWKNSWISSTPKITTRKRTVTTEAFRDDARSWALRTLNGDSSHVYADIPSVLRLVTDEDYLLPVHQADAAQIIAGSCRLSDALLNHSARLERHRRLCGKIDEFRRAYFELNCKTRIIKWNSLIFDCSQFPDLTAQLTRLKAGLTVNWPKAHQDPQTECFLQAFREIFLASPKAAGGLRAEFCGKWEVDSTTGKAVIGRLRKRHPQLLPAVAPWIVEPRSSQLPKKFVLRKAIQSKWFAAICSVAAIVVSLAVFIDFFPLFVGRSNLAMAGLCAGTGLVSAFLVWQKGNQPWFWLLSTPFGVPIAALLPIPGLFRTYSHEERERWQVISNCLGGALSALVLLVIPLAINEDIAARRQEPPTPKSTIKIIGEEEAREIAVRASQAATGDGLSFPNKSEQLKQGLPAIHPSAIKSILNEMSPEEQERFRRGVEAARGRSPEDRENLKRGLEAFRDWMKRKEDAEKNAKPESPIQPQQ